MCLILKDDYKVKKSNKEEYCIGWKVINKDNTQWFKSVGFMVPTPNHKYIIGENISNREYKDLSTFECCSRVIEKGFHIFLYRKDARAEHYRLDSNKIIKVFYKPEDIVAYGVWEMINSSPCVVTMKLTVKDLRHSN